MNRPIETKKVFRARLLEAMGSNHVENVAKLAGMQTSTLSNYMSGRTVPTVDKLASIAYWLNVSADWLIGLADNKDEMTMRRAGNARKVEVDGVVYPTREEAAKAIGCSPPTIRYWLNRMHAPDEINGHKVRWVKDA